jgi:hypothetical protein
MFKTIPDIVENEVPVTLQEMTSQSSTSPISSARVLRLLNQVYWLMHNMCSHAPKPEIQRYMDLEMGNTTTGELTPQLPATLGERICLQRRELYNGGDDEDRGPIHGGWTVNHTYPWTNQDTNADYKATERFLFVNPRVRERKFRLWYLPKVPSLHYSVVGSGQTSSATTLVLNTSPTNGSFDYTPGIYVGQIVFIYQGAGAGQFARITAVNSVNVATVEQQFADGEPLATALGTTSYYSLVPWFNDFYPLMTMLTCIKCLNFDASSQIHAQVAPFMEQFIQWLAPADWATPQPIINKFFSDLGLNAGGAGSLDGFGAWRPYGVL